MTKKPPANCFDIIAESKKHYNLGKVINHREVAKKVRGKYKKRCIITQPN